MRLVVAGLAQHQGDHIVGGLYGRIWDGVIGALSDGKICEDVSTAVSAPVPAPSQEEILVKDDFLAPLLSSTERLSRRQLSLWV